MLMKKINLILFFILIFSHTVFSQGKKDLSSIEPIGEINCYITMYAHYPSSSCKFIIPAGYGVMSSYEIGQTACINAELEYNSTCCITYTLNYDDWVFMGKPATQVSTICAYKKDAFYVNIYQTYNIIINIQ